MVYMAKILYGDAKKHTAQHEAGNTVLRYALREEYGCPELPETARGIYGKPFFPEYPHIQFNISHSGEYVLCALGQKELGIDIEHTRASDERLYARVLSARERSWLERQKDKKAAFIRLWTLKESYIKATGEGFRTEVRKVEFWLPEGEEKESIICSQSGYAFYQRALSDGNYLSLCMQGDRIPEEMKKLRILFL